MPFEINYDELYGSKTEGSKLPLPEDYYKQVVQNYSQAGTGEFAGDAIKSRYDIDTTIYDQPNLQQLRAERQPWYAQAGAALGQATNEALLGTVQGLAALGDLPSYSALLNNSAKSDEDFHNAVYDWAKSTKEAINEEIPIYSGDRFDSGWFWKNLGQTIGSAASFYIPGMGAAKLLGKFGEAVKLGTTASKTLQTLGGAAVMRHAENFQEASSIYDTVYDSALKAGKTNEEAIDLASEAAASDYKMNAANYAFDVLQMGAILKPKFASKVLGTAERQPYQVLKAANLLPESKISKLSKWATDPAKGILEAGSEGLEEIVNTVSQFEATRDADIKLGNIKDDGSDFVTRLGKYLGSEELQDSFIWGTVGGAAFKGLALATGTDENRQDVRNKIEELSSRPETLKNYSSVANSIINDTTLSDKKKAEALSQLDDELAFDLGISSRKAGTTEVLLEQLNQPEFQKQFVDSGVSTQEEVSYKIPQLKKKIEQAAYTYDKYFNKFYESPISQTAKNILMDEGIQYEKEIHSNLENLDKLKRAESNIIAKDPQIKVNMSNPAYMFTAQWMGYKLAKEELSDRIKDTTDEQDKKDLTKLYDSLDKSAKAINPEFIVSKFHKNPLSENFAQQYLTNGYNDILNSRIENLDKPEMTKAAQKAAEVLEEEGKKFVKENTAKAKAEDKANRVQETRDKVTPEPVQPKEVFIDNERSNIVNTPEEAITIDPITAAKEQIENNRKVALNSITEEGTEVPYLVEFPGENESLESDSKEDLINEINARYDAQLKELEEYSTEETAEIVEEDPNQYDYDKYKEVTTIDAQTEQQVSEANADKDVDASGNISYEYNRSRFGHNIAAYLQRLFKQSWDGNVVKRQDIDNNLNPEFTKEVLDYNKYNVGTEVTISVEDRDDIPVYIPGSTTKEQTTWGAIKNTVDYNKYVPLVVKDNAGNTLFYLHSTDWIKEENVYGDIVKDKENLSKIREYVVKNGEFKTTIIERRNGTLFRTKNNQLVTLTEAAPDPNLIIGIGADENGSIKTGKNEYYEGELRIKNTRRGVTYTIVKLNKDFTAALPVYNEKISDSAIKDKVIDSIGAAIETYLKKDSLTPALQQVANTIKEANGLDVTTIEGLEDYLKQFINLYNTRKGTLKSLMKEPTFHKGKPDTKHLISIKNKVIEYTSKGTAYSIQNNEQFDLNLKNLKDTLSKMYFAVDANYLNTDKNVTYFNVTSDGVANVESIPYNQFVKQHTKTNVLSFEVSEGVWNYTVQPKFAFDFSKILSEEESVEVVETVEPVSPVEPVTPIEVKPTEPEVKPKRQYKKTNFDYNSYSPATISPLEESARKYIIRELGFNKQEQLTNFLTREVVKELVKNNTGVIPSEIYTKFKTKFDTDLADINENIEIAKEDNDTDNLAKFEAIKQMLEPIVSNWSLIEKFANYKLARINNIKFDFNDDVDLEMEDYEESERNNWDQHQATVDPKKSMSKDMKLFMSDINRLTSEGKIKKTFFGENDVMDYNEVYNNLQAVTANLKPDLDILISAIESNIDVQPWMGAVADKLRKADRLSQNLFVRTMTNHSRQMDSMMYGVNKDGGFDYKFIDSNSASKVRIIQENWLYRAEANPELTYLDEDNYYKMKSGEGSIKTKFVERFDELKSKPELRTTQAVMDWLAMIGIEISPLAANDLRDKKTRGLNFTEQFTAKDGIFVNLRNAVEGWGDNPLEGDGSLYNDTTIQDLAKLESRYNLQAHSNSFRSGNKQVYSYGKNTYAVNRVRDLKNDKNLLNNLSQLAFSKNSLWLKNLKEGTLASNFDISVVSLEAFNEFGSKQRDNRELHNLTPAEIERAKIGFVQASQRDLSGSKAKKRILTLLYPTTSDKTTPYKIRTEAIKIGFNKDGNITDKFIDEVLYTQLVLPEIERIRVFEKLKANGKLAEVNHAEYEKAGFKFMLLPEINTIPGVFDEVGLLNTNIHTDKDIQDAIRNKIREYVDSIVAYKLQNWKKYGIGEAVKDANGNIKTKHNWIDGKFLNEQFKDSVDKNNYVKAAATDMVVQYLVGNANVFMTVIGDPAQFYKSKNSDPVIQAEDTFINIGKRLAGDIAPRDESVASISNNYIQAIVADKKSQSLMLKQLKELIGDKADKYAEFDGTDAQEITTLLERLYMMESYGAVNGQSLPNGFYNAVAPIIQREIDNNNHYYDSAVVSELEKINPEWVDVYKNLVFQPTKPVYQENIADLSLGIERRVYIKSSDYPLVPSATKGFEIDKLRIQMEKAGISRLAFKTAVKVGSVKTPATIFNTDGTIVDKIDWTNSTLVLPRSGFGYQQEVPYDEMKKAINRVSQASKNLFNNILSVKDFDYKGRKVDGAELQKIYHDLYDKLFKLQKDELVKRLTTADGNFNIQELKELLKEEIQKRDYPISDADALDLDEALTFMAYSPAADKYESLLNSIVQNKIIKTEFAGKSFVVASEEGWQIQEGKSVTESGVVFTKSFTGKLQPNQAIIPFKFRDNEGNLLHLEDYITDGFLDTNKLPREILNVLVMRIPNQGLNSQRAIEIVGFLPHSSGDSIICSRDLVVQMGQDFDVDKLYTYMYSTELQKDKSLVKRTATVEEKISKLNFTRDSLNKLYLEKYQNYTGPRAEQMQLLSEYSYAPDIDNEFILYSLAQIAKGQSMDIQDTEGINPELALDFKMAASKILKDYNYGELLESKYEYNLDKYKADVKKQILQNEILDIHLAIHNNQDTRVQKQIVEPLGFWILPDLADFVSAARKSRFATSLKFTGLSDEYQKQKFINGTASKSGVGVFSVDSTFNAVAQGKNLILTVENKPVKMVIGDEEFNGDLSSELGLDNKTYKSDIIAGFQSAAVDNEKEQILDKLNINTYTFKAYKFFNQAGFTNGTLLVSQDIIFDYVEEIARLKSEGYIPNVEKVAYENIIAKYTPNEVEVKNEDLTEAKLREMIEKGSASENYNNYQKLILDLFTEADMYGQAIQTVQSAINTDSKGLDKNLFGTIIKEMQVGNINGVGIKNADALLGVMVEGKIVKPTTINGQAIYHGLYTNNELWNRFFPYQQTFLKKMFAKGEQIFGSEDRATGKRADFQRKLWNAFKSYLYSNIEFGLTKDIAAEKERLFFGENNIGKRLLDLQEKEEYANHPLISRIQVQPGEPVILKFNAVSKENSSDVNVYVAFIDLLQQEETKEFAKDLVTAAYLSGGIQEAIQYIKYIPVSYLHELPFSEQLSKTVEQRLFDQNKYIEMSVDTNTPYWMLPNFLVQYVQHNPTKLPQLTDPKQWTVVTGDRKNLESVTSIYITDNKLNVLRGFKMVPPEFVTMYDRDRKRGVNKNHIYQFTGEYKQVGDTAYPVYYKLDNLGTFGYSEYNSNLVNGVNQKTSIGVKTISKDTIYSQLGNKTQSENIVIKPWGELKEVKEAITNTGVVATRIFNSDKHFGNPFTHDAEIASKNKELIKVSTTREAVEKYIDWVINSKDSRAIWIREQLKSGKLKGKPILYYKELGEPSHATALDYLINKYNWGTEVKKTPQMTLPQTPVTNTSSVENKQQNTLNVKSGGKKELLTALQDITLNSNDPYLKMVAQELLDNSDRIPELTFDTKFTAAKGRWNSDTKTLSINTSLNKHDLEQALIHETLHSITKHYAIMFRQNKRKLIEQKNSELMRALVSIEKLHLDYRAKIMREDPQGFEQFEKDLKDAQLHPEKKIKIGEDRLSKYYGAHNMEEFITMAMTDSGFQRILNELPSGEHTWWESFMDKLQKFFSALGFDIKNNSVLATAIDDILFVVKQEPVVESTNENTKPIEEVKTKIEPKLVYPIETPKEGEEIEVYEQFGTYYKFILDSNKNVINGYYSQGSLNSWKELVTPVKKYNIFTELDFLGEKQTKNLNAPELVRDPREYILPSGKIIYFNDQQFEALNKIDAWFKSDKKFFTLSGYAGTGKSTIVKKFIDKLPRVAVSAPTHKARKVIEKTTGKSGFTIQALLGLKPNTDIENFDINNPQFDPKTEKKIGDYKLIVIDESSMLNKDLYDLLIKEANNNKTKILFMGDKAQIPPVKEKESKVFNDVPNTYNLTKVERTKDSNPLVKIFDSIRNNLGSSVASFKYVSEVNSNNEGVIFTSNRNEFADRAVQYFTSKEYKEDANFAKIIAWTNASVQAWNNKVRDSLFGETAAPLEVGEIIMAYNNVEGGPYEPNKLENSADYKITNVVKAEKMGVGGFNINYEYVEGGKLNHTLFVVNKTDKASIRKFLDMFEEKLESAKKALPYERGRKWAEYYNFKKEFILQEDLRDPNGNLIVKKDIDYGYAITGHKSQGSTYNNVFIVEDDINKNINVQERNQIKYVAFSRASERAFVLSNNTETELSNEVIESFSPATQPRIPSDKEILKQAGELNADGKSKLLAVTDDNYKVMIKRAQKVNFMQPYYKATVRETFGEGVGYKSKKFFYISLELRKFDNFADVVKLISDEEVQKNKKICKGR